MFEFVVHPNNSDVSCRVGTALINILPPFCSRLWQTVAVTLAAENTVTMLLLSALQAAYLCWISCIC